jgi:DNA modification methylase
LTSIATFPSDHNGDETIRWAADITHFYYDNSHPNYDKDVRPDLIHLHNLHFKSSPLSINQFKNADTQFGKTRVSKASKIIQRENIRQEFLEKARTEAKYNNDNDNLKLYCGDFRDVCRKYIPDNSINLIFTDPPYSRQHLLLYQSLASEAFRMLKEDGSLVMYARHYALPEIFDYTKNSGLKYRWQIVVIHTGSLARMFSNTLIVTYKPLLWYFKAPEPKILESIKDSVESKPPDKSLHPWAQSTVEAEHVISKLTIPNDVVLDCTMGTGTTAIAALKLKRRFVGIEQNADTLAIS